MRARSLKPGFFKNVELADKGPHAQLLFAGLWGVADREGRLKDEPRKIKAELFPYYDVDVNELLTVIASLGFIHRYVVSGVHYVEVANFKKHQSPHKTERASDLPARPKESAIESVDYLVQRDVTMDAPLPNDGNRSDSGLLTPSSLTHDSKEIKNTKRPRKPRKSGRSFDPASVANLNLKAWADYVKHRVDIGKRPMTDEGALLLAVELAAKDTATQQAMIDQTRKKGWIGVFPVEQSNGSGDRKAWVEPRTVAQMEADAAAAQQEGGDAQH